jgi:hypothetical protein
MAATHHIIRRAVVAVVASLALAAAPSALAAPASHGELVHIARPGSELNTNQSTNWFGYNQGSLEQGGKLFHAVAGEWTVPTASQHVKGESESSSDWVGIGGGCLDAGCTVGDNTLIQTGTEQDVDASGSPSYSAWYELVPAPSLTITGMTIKPGDRMSASIAETTTPETWSIKIKDVTRGESYSTTVPYTSDYGTAEWIEEVPTVISGLNSGIAPLPNLSTAAFDNAATNGSSASLAASEEMQLTDQHGTVIGTPSAPDSERDGFNLCTWTTSCTAPTSNATATGTSATPTRTNGRPTSSRARVAVRSRFSRVRGHRVKVKLWSPSAAHGTLKLLAPVGARHKRVVIGKASFTLAAGRGQLVGVRLSNSALRMLARDRTLRALVTVAATDLSGNAAHAKSKLTVRRQAAHR